MKNFFFGLFRAALVLALATAAFLNAAAQSPFQFPTANHTLLEKDGGEKFFVGTVGNDWTSGMFGCVRSHGQQIHEGLDIRCLQRDRHHEPADPVLATADGVVVYYNPYSGLSNYGRYLILRHKIEGLEIYSLYAHLHEKKDGIKIGQTVRAGEQIALMGRTANTHEGISKERAHVHFELNFFITDRFSEWHKKNAAGQRNDHGDWNGQNLVGLDPRLILLKEAEQGSKFSLLDFVRNQSELCRVQVRAKNFPWLKRYAPLVRRNPLAETEGIAGYEIAINYNGLPFLLIPRATSEMKSASRVFLVSVNDEEARQHPCRHFLSKKGASWALTSKGARHFDLLTY